MRVASPQLAQPGHETGGVAVQHRQGEGRLHRHRRAAPGASSSTLSSGSRSPPRSRVRTFTRCVRRVRSRASASSAATARACDPGTPVSASWRSGERVLHRHRRRLEAGLPDRPGPGRAHQPPVGHQQREVPRGGRRHDRGQVVPQEGLGAREADQQGGPLPQLGRHRRARGGVLLLARGLRPVLAEVAEGLAARGELPGAVDGLAPEERARQPRLLRGAREHAPAGGHGPPEGVAPEAAGDEEDQQHAPPRRPGRRPGSRARSPRAAAAPPRYVSLGSRHSPRSLMLWSASGGGQTRPTARPPGPPRRPQVSAGTPKRRRTPATVSRCEVTSDVCKPPPAARQRQGHRHLVREPGVDHGLLVVDELEDTPRRALPEDLRPQAPLRQQPESGAARLEHGLDLQERPRGTRRARSTISHSVSIRRCSHRCARAASAARRATSPRSRAAPEMPRTATSAPRRDRSRVAGRAHGATSATAQPSPRGKKPARSSRSRATRPSRPTTSDQCRERKWWLGLRGTCVPP